MSGALKGNIVNSESKACTAEPADDLVYHDWQVKIAADNPGNFLLCYRTQPVFQGQFEVTVNGNLLDLADVSWRFRHKVDRLEQWCNIRDEVSVSISMLYSFREDALMIDYLARSGRPTRLDVRHHIEQLVQPGLRAMQTEQDADSPKAWEQVRNDIPSMYLTKSIDGEFRESFSSTQWIVLDANLSNAC